LRKVLQSAIDAVAVFANGFKRFEAFFPNRFKLNTTLNNRYYRCNLANDQVSIRAKASMVCYVGCSAAQVGDFTNGAEIVAERLQNISGSARTGRLLVRKQLINRLSP